jgi:hypothetical protein
LHHLRLVDCCIALFLCFSLCFVAFCVVITSLCYHQP